MQGREPLTTAEHVEDVLGYVVMDVDVRLSVFFRRGHRQEASKYA